MLLPKAEVDGAPKPGQEVGRQRTVDRWTEIAAAAAIDDTCHQKRRTTGSSHTLLFFFDRSYKRGLKINANEESHTGRPGHLQKSRERQTDGRTERRDKDTEIKTRRDEQADR